MPLQHALGVGVRAVLLGVRGRGHEEHLGAEHLDTVALGPVVLGVALHEPGGLVDPVGDEVDLEVGGVVLHPLGGGGGEVALPVPAFPEDGGQVTHEGAELGGGPGLVLATKHIAVVPAPLAVGQVGQASEVDDGDAFGPGDFEVGEGSLGHRCSVRSLNVRFQSFREFVTTVSS